MKIIITVTDQDLIDAYADTHPDLIAQDFEDHPHSWFASEGLSVRVSKSDTTSQSV